MFVGGWFFFWCVLFDLIECCINGVVAKGYGFKVVVVNCFLDGYDCYLG